MDNFLLPGSKGYDMQMVINSAPHKSYVSIAQEFQKHLSNASRKNKLIC